MRPGEGPNGGASSPPRPHPGNPRPRNRPIAGREGAVRFIGAGRFPNPAWGLNSFLIFSYSRALPSPRIHSRRIDMVRLWGESDESESSACSRPRGSSYRYEPPANASKSRPDAQPPSRGDQFGNGPRCKQRGVCMGIATARAIRGRRAACPRSLISGSGPLSPAISATLRSRGAPSSLSKMAISVKKIYASLSKTSRLTR